MSDIIPKISRIVIFSYHFQTTVIELTLQCQAEGMLYL